jgi:hypothetical protein
VTKVVREHYPVERLPDDLKQEFGLARTVKLVIEAEEGFSLQHAREAAIADLREHRKTLKSSEDDAVLRVRRLRDEWDR